ncbi:HTH domain-containing protein [Candidatus Woesebacteria bacterium]|nr:HTH domain-containing protein [Candidatus Woesebacteria bacterium]
MAKTKTREITIIESSGGFSIFKNPFLGKEEFDFSGVTALRQLLTNEKAKILHTIKTQKPTSIYDLAKRLNRGFKAVYGDVKLLERFGFIELISEKSKKRNRLKPVIAVDRIVIDFKV